MAAACTGGAEGVGWNIRGCGGSECLLFVIGVVGGVLFLIKVDVGEGLLQLALLGLVLFVFAGGVDG